MIIQQPKVIVPKNEINISKLKNIERYGRVCYKSENLIDEKSAKTFIKEIIKRGHESVIEHEKATVIMPFVILNCFFYIRKTVHKKVIIKIYRK